MTKNKKDLKIYFSGSIRGGRESVQKYGQIITMLKNYGVVLTEHIGNSAISDQGENKPIAYVYERDVNWLKTADVVVADVTIPSIGVGYEIALGEVLGKPVLCLYDKNAQKRISGMIEGNKNLTIGLYEKTAEISNILENFFKNYEKK